MVAETSGHTLEEIIDELARVLHDPESARELVLRARFPPADLPAFDVPRVFWSRVIRAAADGKILEGMQAIVVLAAAAFPGNPIFAGYRSSTTAASKASEQQMVGAVDNRGASIGQQIIVQGNATFGPTIVTVPAARSRGKAGLGERPGGFPDREEEPVSEPTDAPLGALGTEPSGGATGRDGRWRLIAGVVEALERGGAPEGTVVTRNVAVPYRTDPHRTRQVDIHVAVPAGPRTLTVGIVVKGSGHPLSLEDIEQIYAKLGKLELDRRCLVSCSGFAEEARKDAIPGGLELLSLEELSSVNWWLGPMFMNELRNQIEVVHVRLDYDPQVRPQVLAAADRLPVGKCELVDSRGKSATLYAYGVHHGIQALKEPAVQALESGACFAVQVLPQPESSTSRGWVALRHDDMSLPAPERIMYVYRLHRSWGNTPLTAYALHGQQALTMSFPFVGGKDFQATIVGTEGDMRGVVDLKLVVGSINVPKTSA